MADADALWPGSKRPETADRPDVALIYDVGAKQRNRQRNLTSGVYVVAMT